MALREVIKTRGAAGGMKGTYTHPSASALFPKVHQLKKKKQFFIDLDGASADENSLTHEKWCNDLAAKFLCLFVLDRFSDFVSDQMVAPVRETVSQTLAALLTHMPRRSVLHVHTALLQMVQLSPSSSTSLTLSSNGKTTNGNGNSNGKGKGRAGVSLSDKGGNLGTASTTGEFAWQVRHAGLVGIKYEVAVRPDLFDDPEYGQEVMQGVVDAAVSG